MTDYALWEVILNGDSPPPTRSVDDVETIYPPTNAEEKLARMNELKARGTLLMALPNEHQLKFNSYKAAKSLKESIKRSFGGNKESKKEDLDSKLLRSLPSEWKTHTLIWKNKSDLETLSMDDLYNNLKFYEAKVMRRGHFAKECKAPKHHDNMNKEAPKRIVPVKESTLNDLVSQCDRLGYD
nr:hypothetical protein [Tanacetum cinerariifolium]